MVSARPRFRHYLLLTAAAALATYGVIGWHDSGLSMVGLLLYDNGWRPHPLHLLVLGLGALPPAMWEIFWQDARHRARDTDLGDKDADVEPSRG